MQTVSPSETLFLSLFTCICLYWPKHMDSAVHRTNSLSTACRLCNVVYSSKTALEQHYVESLEHPNCTHCHIGFPDSAARQAVSPFQSASSAVMFVYIGQSTRSPSIAQLSATPVTACRSIKRTWLSITEFPPNIHHAQFVTSVLRTRRHLTRYARNHNSNSFLTDGCSPLV